jgi:hypothetical protein
MTQWPQYEMVSSPRGKILAMDSAGYADERNDVSDERIARQPLMLGLVMPHQQDAWSKGFGVLLNTIFR